MSRIRRAPKNIFFYGFWLGVTPFALIVVSVEFSRSGYSRPRAKVERMAPQVVTRDRTPVHVYLSEPRDIRTLTPIPESRTVILKHAQEPVGVAVATTSCLLGESREVEDEHRYKDQSASEQGEPQMSDAGYVGQVQGMKMGISPGCLTAPEAYDEVKVFPAK